MFHSKKVRFNLTKMIRNIIFWVAELIIITVPQSVWKRIFHHGAIVM